MSDRVHIKRQYNPWHMMIAKVWFDAPPESIEDAEWRLEMVVFEIEDMERQLANPESHRPDGTPKTRGEIESWRGRCQKALAHQKHNKTTLERWIEDQGEAVQDDLTDDLNEGSAESLLRAAVGIFERLLQNGLAQELTDREIVAVERMRNFVELNS